MSKVVEDEVVEYESDPEEEKQFLGRRRREAASDDEETEGEEKLPVGRRAPIHSDELDGQGAAAEYDDEDEDEQGIYEDEEEMYEDEEEDQNDRREVADLGSGNGSSEVEAIQRRVEHEEEEIKEDNVGEEEGKEGRKENEPFSVPTAGAFYMHDDRFRDNAGGRHRNTFGGRKLWELKDDKKWGHDKFEEMTKQERCYEQGRRGMKGNYRGRDGKIRLPGKGYPRRSRSRAFSNDENQYQAQKTVRGRGPRKYDTTMRNTSHSRPAQDKQLRKPHEKASHSNLGRNSAPTSSNEALPARKHSSLSSASPPFYPSGSSNKEIASNQKRDIQVGSTSRSLPSSGGDGSFPVQQAGTILWGKNLHDSVPMDKLYINDSVNQDGKFLNNMQVPSGGSSPGNNIQTSHSRAQGRDVAISMPAPYQPVSIHNQVNRVSSATPIHAVQRSSSQSRIQHPIQPPNQQSGQRGGSGSQGSPSNSSTMNSYESTETKTTSGSNKSKTALVGKGKSAVQSNGRGFSYGGTQVLGSMGNVGVGHGDQNFSAFLPVMQFGRQDRGGMTVPALGMAFPGYVAQPQLGVGNSEMTWLPVLTGAAGALGATYCPPYIAVDGAYHTHTSGQSSSVGSLSKENSTSKPTNERQPSQRPETVSDDSGQRQKPRRYSEMDFKQQSTNT